MPRRTINLFITIVLILGFKAYANPETNRPLLKKCEHLLYTQGGTAKAKDTLQDLISLVTYAQIIVLPNGKKDHSLGRQILQKLTALQQKHNVSLELQLADEITALANNLMTRPRVTVTHNPSEAQTDQQNFASNTAPADESFAIIISETEPTLSSQISESLEGTLTALPATPAEPSAEQAKLELIAKLKGAIGSGLENTSEARALVSSGRAMMSRLTDPAKILPLDYEVYRWLQKISVTEQPWISETVTSGWYDLIIDASLLDYGVTRGRVYFSFEDLKQFSLEHGYEVKSRELVLSFVLEGSEDERFKNLPRLIKTHRVDPRSQNSYAKISRRNKFFAAHRQTIGAKPKNQVLVQTATGLKYTRPSNSRVLTFPLLLGLSADQPIEIKTHIEANGAFEAHVTALLNEALTAQREIKMVGSVRDGGRRRR